MVDIAVSYEQGGALKDVSEGKVRKYSILIISLLEKFGDEAFAVLPLVVGRRGALPEFTKRKWLGLTVSTDGLTMAMTSLRCSLAIAASTWTMARGSCFLMIRNQL